MRWGIGVRGQEVRGQGLGVKGQGSGVRDSGDVGEAERAKPWGRAGEEDMVRGPGEGWW